MCELRNWTPSSCCVSWLTLQPLDSAGEVVAEEGKPKEELKSFWEAHQPVDVIPPSPPRRSTADASNVGKKWQVSQKVLGRQGFRFRPEHLAVTSICKAVAHAAHACPLCPHFSATLLHCDRSS